MKTLFTLILLIVTVAVQAQSGIIYNFSKDVEWSISIPFDSVGNPDYANAKVEGDAKKAAISLYKQIADSRLENEKINNRIRRLRSEIESLKNKIEYFEPDFSKFITVIYGESIINPYDRFGRFTFRTPMDWDISKFIAQQEANYNMFSFSTFGRSLAVR